MPIDLETVRNLAPPVYGEHRFDQLYSEVDLSGFMTPAGGASGIGTPFTSHSRTTSAENLTSMDALTLQSRLHNLEPGGLSRWARDRPYHPSGSADDAFESNQDLHRDGESCPAAQNPTLLNGCFDNSESPDQTSYSTFVSRRPSEEDAVPTGTHTPQHIELSLEDLAKVPSYSTARHSRAIAPINDGLPNYQAAIRTPIAQPPLPRVPSHAHVVNHVEDDASQAMHVN